MALNARAAWRASTVSSASLFALLATSTFLTPTLALAQQQPTTVLEDIVVTAQRQAESLQDVPIAVAAFGSADLEKRQIESFGDLQFSAPNVNFTVGNFTTSNITIRGVGNAVVGGGSESGVGIHFNDMPVLTPRMLEIEYFDIERIEVLRGPQGTLFGRNATGGAVNVISKKASHEFGAEGEIEYGNYDSIKVKGMVNVPLVDQKLAVRLSGIYINRDGYTKNIYTGNKIDGRDQYALRGTIRFEPSENTRIDLTAQYFREDDNRSRIQKQMCNNDATGILGCAPDSLEFEPVNTIATLGGLLSSSVLLSGPLSGLALMSPGNTSTTGVVNPTGYRKVNIDFEPKHDAEETMVTLAFQHDFEKFNFSVVAGYQDTYVDSNTDYLLVAENPQSVPAAFAASFPTVYNLFYTQGFPVSAVDMNGYAGVANGNIAYVGDGSTSYDRSYGDSKQYSFEAKLASQFDGAFNFLVGGIYFDQKSRTDYNVIAAGLDYAGFLLPTVTTLSGCSSGATPPATCAAIATALATGTQVPLDGVFVAPSYYGNESNETTLKSWALFGEAYYEFNDELKLTLGGRYLQDKKTVYDRQVLFNTPQAVNPGGVPAGLPDYRSDRVKFKRVTGRAVIDWSPTLSFTDSTLVYASYSRGFKSGGFNPPFDPVVFPDSSPYYGPETINAFEIGTKNTLAGGTLQVNLTGFYYDYKGLQISTIRNRTSFNENIDAEVYGLESEFLAKPTPRLLLNANLSLLKTKIKNGSFIDTRDPSGGRDDVVIIKEVTTAANCAVIPAAGGVPRADLVAPALFAGGTVPVPGTNTVGAFSSCAALASAIDANSLPYQVVRDANGNVIGLPGGVSVSVKGNELPQSPNWMISLGAQYTQPLGGEYSLTMRMDYSARGSFWGRIYNSPVDKIKGYDLWNAQLQLDAPDDRWFLRAFVQNIENDNSVTGMYVTDPSSGLFTNVFTTEPRRYGLAAGFRF